MCVDVRQMSLAALPRSAGYRCSWLVPIILCCSGPWVKPQPPVGPKITTGHLGIIFKTVDEAALAACAYVRKNKPMATEYEYCGVIYRDVEGIKAGLPMTDEKATRCERPLEPPGTTPEAGYHNHLQTSEFSSYDRRLITPLALYLCTPSGLVKKRTPEGTVIVK